MPHSKRLLQVLGTSLGHLNYYYCFGLCLFSFYVHLLVCYFDIAVQYCSFCWWFNSSNMLEL